MKQQKRIAKCSETNVAFVVSAALLCTIFVILLASLACLTAMLCSRFGVTYFLKGHYDFDPSVEITSLRCIFPRRFIPKKFQRENAYALVCLNRMAALTVLTSNMDDDNVDSLLQQNDGEEPTNGSTAAALALRCATTKFVDFIYAVDDKKIFGVVFYFPDTGISVFSFLSLRYFQQWRCLFENSKTSTEEEDTWKETQGKCWNCPKKFYEKIRPTIWAIWNAKLKHKTSQLVISGHSFGAMLATMCSYDFAKSFSKKKEGPELFVYLTGSPRCGDEKFREEYHNVVPKTHVWNIQNTNDIITRTPNILFDISKYCHVGQFVYFSQTRQTLFVSHEALTYQLYLGDSSHPLALGPL